MDQLENKLNRLQQNYRPLVQPYIMQQVDEASLFCVSACSCVIVYNIYCKEHYHLLEKSENASTSGCTVRLVQMPVNHPSANDDDFIISV